MSHLMRGWRISVERLGFLCVPFFLFSAFSFFFLVVVDMMRWVRLFCWGCADVRLRIAGVVDVMCMYGHVGQSVKLCMRVWGSGLLCM
jgi:hypothetical protein